MPLVMAYTDSRMPLKSDAWIITNLFVLSELTKEGIPSNIGYQRGQLNGTFKYVSYPYVD